MPSHHDYGIDNETFAGGTPDDDPPPYCPLCGVHTGSGVLCEECRDEDPVANVPDVCHCGLPESDHKYPGPAEHTFIPKGSGIHPNLYGPPCRVCHKTDNVICYPDDHALTICPDCCDKCLEHPDGEKGHQWDYDKWERDDVCRYCGIQRRCTDHVREYD